MFLKITLYNYIRKLFEANQIDTHYYRFPI